MTIIGESIRQPTRKEIQLVIAASSLGTVFEWYDFFIYGTLATLIGKLFFPAASATAGFYWRWRPLVWALPCAR
jgi:hypothetical protein